MFRLLSPKIPAGYIALSDYLLLFIIGGGGSSVRGDLAWESEGRRFKSSSDHSIWSVDW